MDRLTVRVPTGIEYKAKVYRWDIKNRLATLEDMLCDRTFWVITSPYDVEHAAPVTIKEIAEDGTFTVTWQVTDEYSEEIEEIDVTDLFHTQAEAEAQVECDVLEKALYNACYALNPARPKFKMGKFIQQAREDKHE